MACDVNGSGCKICPGMWVAVALFVVMTIQNLFFRATTATNAPLQDSASQFQQTKGLSDSSEPD